MKARVFSVLLSLLLFPTIGKVLAAEGMTVGKTAPEITGADVDGKQFKLSEYRGKVVMLDFWGDW